jgi:aminoglycoside 3-N-acetyltransferase
LLQRIQRAGRNGILQRLLGHDRNTSLHLAEHRAGIHPERSFGAPLLVDGRRVWSWYPDIDLDDEAFPRHRS